MVLLMIRRLLEWRQARGTASNENAKLRRDLKSLLLGWVLGFIIGAVFMGIVVRIVNDENLFTLLLAILSLVIYVVLAFKRKWKPLWIAVPLGIVINPLLWFGLFLWAWACLGFYGNC